ncbi:MAG: methyl-accepting chemotaxis protein [Planctomycetota bacterium]
MVEGNSDSGMFIHMLGGVTAKPTNEAPMIRSLNTAACWPLLLILAIGILWPAAPSYAGDTAEEPGTATETILIKGPPPLGEIAGHASTHADKNTNKIVHGQDYWVEKLGQSETFTIPAYEQIERVAFGHEFGEFEEIPANVLVETSPLLLYLAWAAVGLTLLVTVAGAAKLSRLKRDQKKSRRSLTLGTKLTLAFGGLTTALVFVGAIAVSAMHQNNQTNYEVEFSADNVAMVEAIERDLLHLELAAEDFLLTNAEYDLEYFSDYSARMLDRLKHAEKELNTAEEREAAALLVEHTLEYEAEFKKIVALVDRFNGIVDSQLVPTGERLNDLLLAIIETAHVEGNYKLAIEAAEALDHLALARIQTQIYLRTNREEEAKIAAHELQLGAELLDLMHRDVRGEVQTAWMKQAEAGYRFYAKEFQIAIDLSHEREELIEHALHKLGKKIDKEGLALIGQLRHDQAELIHDSEERTARAMNILAAVIALAIAFSAGVSVWLIRKLVGSSRRVLRVLAAVAEGDLTQEPIDMKAGDEMGEIARATDRMSASLKEVIRDVTTAAHEVAGASNEIAESSDEIARGMNEQTGQVHSVSSAVEEMSASIVEVARKSADAASSAEKSGRVAQEGGQVVSETIDGMNAISVAVSDSARSVEELGKRGEQIGEIIATINDIADQTNLLALNAAIEAARAGEHGRGFAVVADEVRKLADRTTQATEEIGSSIEAIQTETTSAVERMHAGTEQVTTGVTKASAAGDSLKEIVASAQDVSGMIQSIAAAAEEQSAASEEVARSVETISSLSQTTAEGGQQAAQAASMLSQKAETLQSLCGRFKL